MDTRPSAFYAIILVAAQTDVSVACFLLQALSLKKGEVDLFKTHFSMELYRVGATLHKITHNI